MKSEYRIPMAKAVLSRKRSVWHIEWITVDPQARGKGLGVVLMSQVIQEADAEGVTLTLEAVACAGLKQERLEAWYESLGFVKTGRRGGLGGVRMVRKGSK